SPATPCSSTVGRTSTVCSGRRRWTEERRRRGPSAAGRARGRGLLGTGRIGRVVEVLWARAEGLGVGEDGVDLPLLPRRSGDPHLVLGGEAAGGADLLVGEQTLVGQTGDLGVHLLRRLDLHAEVVDGATLAGVLEQDELER